MKKLNLAILLAMAAGTLFAQDSTRSPESLGYKVGYTVGYAIGLLWPFFVIGIIGYFAYRFYKRKKTNS